jgi:hypothetical protein
LAGPAPPHQRSKARYLNVHLLVDWAKESLLLLDRPKAIRQAVLKPRQVECKHPPYRISARNVTSP